ncbi:MAG: TetR/AcrR family transcriptional regulator [Bacteroidales bacterium]|nr:TetR/AcrR family transcriptional regulator [Bacteroidales bacterium]
MTKEHIIKTARGLFEEMGLKNTTMDDIARHAGVSKRTIYEHFKNKEDLLTDGVNRFYEEGKEYFNHVLASTDNVVEATVIMLRKGMEESRKNRYYIMEDIKKYAPSVHQNHLIAKNAEQQKAMEDMVKKGIREGVFRSDLNPEIVAIIFALQSKGILTNNQPFDKFSIFELFENMVLLYLRGLCTPKGLEILERILSKKTVNS